MHSRFIHDIECIRMLSLFQAESYSTVCICEIMANSHVVLRSNTEILYNFHPISPKGNILHHFSTISQISENYYWYNPFTLFLFHHLNLILCEYVCESELYLVLCNFTTRIGWCDQHEFQHKELSCYIFIATAATQALFTNPWQPLISPPCLQLKKKKLSPMWTESYNLEQFGQAFFPHHNPLMVHTTCFVD